MEEQQPQDQNPEQENQLKTEDMLEEILHENSLENSLENNSFRVFNPLSVDSGSVEDDKRVNPYTGYTVPYYSPLRPNLTYTPSSSKIEEEELLSNEFKERDIYTDSFCSKKTGYKESMLIILLLTISAVKINKIYILTFYQNFKNVL